MGIIDDETLKMYIEESREHLGNIENDLLAIEEGGADIDEALVNKVFRAAHSIKGGAGFFNLAKIQELAHKIENVLDMVRSRELVPNPEMVNILLISFDKLRELVNNVQTSNEADIAEFTVSLTGLATSYLKQEEKQSVVNMVDIGVPGGAPIMSVSEFDLNHAQKGGKLVYLVEYDLIHDVQRLGKTPLDVIKSVMDMGVILNCALDLLAVGTLEDDAAANRIPFFVLFATSIEPNMISKFFEIDSKRIHCIRTLDDAAKASSSQPKAAAPAPAPAPAPAAPAAPAPKAAPKAKKPAAEAAAPAEGGEEGGVKEHAASAAGETSLRVDVKLLESLMNLAGELVLSRNQLLESITQNDQRVMHVCGQRINQVTSELQEAIMLTRMQPIGNIMGKFPRVVRDLSRDLGKEVRLNLAGKEVEMDKTIVEGLSDPLTHMVRNAVDHGVEDPDTRAKAGKPACGTINLRAYHEAGQVNIEISDDGKGIDPDKVAAAAVAKGLLVPEKVKGLSKKEKIALIFLPGLSTAEKVTGVSGRGVGMDVVKTNIDRLGGQLDIESEMGKGSTFRIKLPLTLAIIPCLLVSVDKERFAIPQVNVDELIRITAEQAKFRLEIVGDAEVLVLRGKLIPIVHLADILGMARSYMDPKDSRRKLDQRQRLADRRSKVTPLTEEELAAIKKEDEERRKLEEQRTGKDRRYHASSDLNIVVVTAGTFQYGLVVEQLHDTLEIVVKPLGRFHKNLREYAGATIMGDGRVALILDVCGLAAVAGINSNLSNSARALELEKETKQEKGQDVHSFLLFRNGPQEQCAVHLDLVERVDQIKSSDVEIIGGKRVMKYRGGTLPLFALKDVVPTAHYPEDQNLVVIIFNVADHEFGLIATPPVDVIETEIVVDQTTFKQKGVLGSSIISGRITLIVDIYEMVDVFHPEWLAGRSKTSLADNGQAVTVLLAEDSEFFRNQVVRFLESDGYRVLAGEDGQAAWDILQQKAEEISLVVTDIEMPRMDGYGLARNIKGNPKFSHLPIIALTSLASDEDIAKGKAAGVDEYQVKLDRENLLNAIHSMLSRTQKAEV